MVNAPNADPMEVARAVRSVQLQNARGYGSKGGSDGGYAGSR